MAKMSLLNLRSHQNNVHEAPAEPLWCTQTVFLSKQVPTIVTGRQSDAQTIKVLGAYTSNVI